MCCFSRNRCLHPLAEIALVTLAALFAAGCRTAAPRAGHATGGGAAAVAPALETTAESQYCRVHSVAADAELAEALAGTITTICREFESRGWPILPQPINVFLYKRWADFQAAVGPTWLGPQYDGAANIGRGALYLFHEWQSADRLQAAARHETTHLLLHQAGGFRVPATVRTTVGQDILPSVPWWLEEGLACCMEPGPAAKGPAAGIHASRCRELQKLIQEDRCPSVAEVLGKPFETKGSGDDYAVAWGVLYDVLFPPQPSSHTAGLRRLHAYLEACRRGFLTDPDREFGPRFLRPDGLLPPGFEQAWSAHIAAASLAAFPRLLLPPDTSLAEWESGWRQRMMQLKPGAAAPPPRP